MELPERASGAEWYFFTPRDRKYPNGSRQQAGRLSKVIAPTKPPRRRQGPLGQEVAVFYHGSRAKTDRIMHGITAGYEVRRKEEGRADQLDDWCSPPTIRRTKGRRCAGSGGGGGQGVWPPSGETRTPESDVDNDAFPELDSLPTALQGMRTTNAAMLPKEEVQELEMDTDEWLMWINLDDLQARPSMSPWDYSTPRSWRWLR
ncbi:hypothetical protein ZWY2020_059888 [Hordeum vulgare]|nr:hypothetical protein ZWY2020_059888 [Hordeum vulgare]